MVFIFDRDVWFLHSTQTFYFYSKWRYLVLTLSSSIIFSVDRETYRYPAYSSALKKKDKRYVHGEKKEVVSAAKFPLLN